MVFSKIFGACILLVSSVMFSFSKLKKEREHLNVVGEWIELIQ